MGFFVPSLLLVVEFSRRVLMYNFYVSSFSGHFHAMVNCDGTVWIGNFH